MWVHGRWREERNTGQRRRQAGMGRGGEGTGVADMQVCCLQKHIHPTKVANEENILIFFSGSRSINGCCSNTRNYWSFWAFLLVRSQHSSQCEILAPRCPRYFVFQMQECQLPDKKWCILSSRQHAGQTPNLECVSWSPWVPAQPSSAASATPRTRILPRKEQECKRYLNKTEF